MWRFKRKYKKSEWFKGLLEAEELYKDGYSYTWHAVWHAEFGVWFSKEDSTVGVGPLDRKVGALDYVKYFEDNKELIESSR